MVWHKEVFLLRGVLKPSENTLFEEDREWQGAFPVPVKITAATKLHTIDSWD